MCQSKGTLKNISGWAEVCFDNTFTFHKTINLSDWGNEASVGKAKRIWSVMLKNISYLIFGQTDCILKDKDAFETDTSCEWSLLLS